MIMIADEVDVEKWKYVVPFTYTVTTTFGYVTLPRGFLFDGATGVVDLCETACWTHDWLYLRGRSDSGRVTRYLADLMYGDVLMRNWHPMSAMRRTVGLWLLGGRAWREHRERERQNPDHWKSRFVPRQHEWQFRSWRTEQAVWCEPGHEHHDLLPK